LPRDDRTPERRKRPRYPAVYLGLIKGLGPREPDEGSFLGRTRNISEGGALVELQEPLPIGGWIQLSCSLGQALLELRAQVLDCRSAGDMGYQVRVRFLNLDGGSRELLRAYLATQEPEQI